MRTTRDEQRIRDHPVRRHGRLHRSGLRGVPARPRRARLARSSAAARRSRASRRSPGRRARDEEWRRTDIRGVQARRLRAAGRREPDGRGRAALDAALEDARARTTPPASSTSTARRPARPTRRKLGGAVFVDLDRAVKDHPELLERYLLTEAVTPARRRLRGPARGVLDRRDAALRAQGRQGRGPALQPGRAGRRRAASTWSHTLVVLEEGAEATLVRETAGRGRGDAPALHVGAVEVFVGQGAQLRFVNIQNWDDGTWHFSRERALVGPRRRRCSGPSAASGRGWPRSTRRSRWPGRGPRPRSTASCSPPAGSTWPTSPGRTTWPRTPPATCSTRGASRTSRGSSGRG